MQIIKNASYNCIEEKEDSISIDVINSPLSLSRFSQAKSLRMVHPGSQWLYVISDAAGRESKVTSFAELLAEGENVVFIHNATNDVADCNVIKRVYALAQRPFL